MLLLFFFQTPQCILNKETIKEENNEKKDSVMKPEAFNSPELRLLSPSSLLFFLLFLFCLLPSSSEAFSLHSSSHFSLNNVHPNKGFKFSPLFFSPLHAQQQQRPAFILESSTRMHAAETQPVQEAAGPAASAAPAEAAAEESAAAAKRFGAAPLAAAVFAEAELGAAAAVAAADAAAAAAEPAAPGPVALIAAPRGFCEGVSRAVGTVEKALEIYGPPVYVNHQIVHNEFVCKQLESRGAVFVEDISLIPMNSVVIFSAHGVSPSIREIARKRNLITIDATCPLVQKVHVYVQQKAREGFNIIIIGHKNHVEVQGVCGEAPGRVYVVEKKEDVERLPFCSSEKKLFFVTQTTLSLLDCKDIENALRKKFPFIQTIKSGSVCYATTNRQAALRALAAHAQLAIVIGSCTSSNALRLVEIAKSRGIPAYLVSKTEDINPQWLVGVKRVAVSASASTPEELTKQILSQLKTFNASLQIEAKTIEEKKPVWKLPRTLQEHAQRKDEEKITKAA